MVTEQKKKGVEETDVSITIEEDARVSGFAGWFTADFHGTEANPCPCPVTLSTGPENGYTHWGQQVFHLQVPHDVVGGGRVEGTIAVKRQKENVRLVSDYMIRRFFFVRLAGMFLLFQAWSSASGTEGVRERTLFVQSSVAGGEFFFSPRLGEIIILFDISTRSSVF